MKRSLRIAINPRHMVDRDSQSEYLNIIAGDSDESVVAVDTAIANESDTNPMARRKNS